jgi:hypothetical protein
MYWGCIKPRAPVRKQQGVLFLSNSPKGLFFYASGYIHQFIININQKGKL